MARVTVTDGIPDYAFERNATAERMVSEAGLREGGTLVIQAGERHLPLKYEGHPLLAMLPVDSNRPAWTDSMACS